MEVTDRPLRADAERNRLRLLAAAHSVFAAQGLDAGVEEIAREAGVGVGTLYRRFPTKESLVAAIVEQRFAAISSSFAAVAASSELEPWEAFEACALALAQAIAEDRGFFQVVSETVGRLDEIRAMRAAMLAVLEPVVRRAQEAGVVRGDVTVEDVPALCAVAARLPRWKLEESPEVWRRYLGIVLDGLRPDGATPLPTAEWPDRAAARR
ncbi:MAG: Transcriptional regulator, AcrR family [uncultured Solirubrobacteraceae bacterium]|uniref:Transcriptional regulator, AcrR family n=1 Tax=uncultured Solirubrobacteraceae bacterium TaxID=1162706 RepID=A0A6J4SN27_9ACTN|nr:MAG: Transcriptional regulator, AcrR family [uncultured Solirubrobacteraceae bacterium]